MIPRVNVNPVYLYGALVALIQLFIGIGLLTLTDVQQDLVLKTFAALILLTTGTTVGAAEGVKKANE